MINLNSTLYVIFFGGIAFAIILGAILFDKVSRGF